LYSGVASLGLYQTLSISELKRNLLRFLEKKNPGTVYFDHSIHHSALSEWTILGVTLNPKFCSLLRYAIEMLLDMSKFSVHGEF
jgi:hypothetical protein